MWEGGDYTSSSSGAAEGLISNKRKAKNKRRFSDDQIKSLETMFQSETKLEPRKKMQLARDLGLQPRQVSIWFQNKRARWKSKQLERDYNVLRANYDSLASQFETLKKEKQSLVSQLQKLNDLVEKSQKKEGQLHREEEVSGSSTGRVSDYNGGPTENEFDVKPRLSLEYGVGVLSDDDSGIKTDYLGLEEDDQELLSMVEPADSSLTSPEEWGSLEEQPTTSCQWWDFWS